ncbi:MAG TPA: invasion associated locus B family protein [Alphaproteobacteria bacterium]|nr:invasion associated locus B family protein [Alphaproteobacteria bacterium]
MKLTDIKILRAALFVLALVGAGAALAPLPAAAQGKGGAQAIGNFGSWQALTYKEGGADVCYVASLPTKSEGHAPKPGEANILVTHWPARKNFGVVSIAIGGDYKKDSHVELQIGTDKFSLFTQGNRAWANDGDDAKIVASFKAGRDVVVRAVPAKGARTTDVYSLDGFTKAYETASKACHVKA